MKITIEPTAEFARIDAPSIPVRIWTGTTEKGVPIHVFVAMVAARAGQDLTELDQALVEKAPGSVRTVTEENVAAHIDLGSGQAVFADDPRASVALPICAVLNATLHAEAVRCGSWGPVLDALASVYLNELVRRTGPTNAASAFEGMKQAIAAVVAAQQAPELGAAKAQGRA